MLVFKISASVQLEARRVHRFEMRAVNLRQRAASWVSPVCISSYRRKMCVTSEDIVFQSTAARQTLHPFYDDGHLPHTHTHVHILNNSDDGLWLTTDYLQTSGKFTEWMHCTVHYCCTTECSDLCKVIKDTETDRQIYRVHNQTLCRPSQLQQCIIHSHSQASSLFIKKRKKSALKRWTKSEKHDKRLCNHYKRHHDCVHAGDAVLVHHHHAPYSNNLIGKLCGNANCESEQIIRTTCPLPLHWSVY